MRPAPTVELLVWQHHERASVADGESGRVSLVVDHLQLHDPPKGSALALGNLPAAPRMAVCVRVGLPEDAHLVTAKIGRFIAANGDALDRPSREWFLQPPDAKRMHESVVEMQFPLRQRAMRGN